jgi:hypothetical protein
MLGLVATCKRQAALKSVCTRRAGRAPLWQMGTRGSAHWERSRAHDVGPPATHQASRQSAPSIARRTARDLGGPEETPSGAPCVRVGPARASQRHQQPPNLFCLPSFPTTLLYSPCRPLPPLLSPRSPRHATQRIVSSRLLWRRQRSLRATKGGSGDEDAVEGVLDRGLLPPALLLLRRPHGRPSLSVSPPSTSTRPLFAVVLGGGVWIWGWGFPSRRIAGGLQVCNCLGSNGTGRFARQPLASRAIAEMPSCLSVL